MSWRDRLSQASFRGVPFKVDTSDHAGGRRTVVHEYPQRDVPFVEDLGRKARAFQIECYVLGADYLSARDALIDALERSGPGELVHPYYGTRRVAVTGGFRVRETRDEGGMARFSVEFTETAAAALQPTAAPDLIGGVQTAAASARDSVVAEFLATYSPGTYLASASAALQNASLAVRSALAPLSLDEQARAGAQSLLNAFEADVSSLVSTPADLVSRVSALFDLFSSSSAPVLAVYGFGPGVRPPATTPQRVQEQTNFDAIQRLVQRLAVVRGAELVLGETLSSYEEATTAREAVTDLIDDQAEIASDDTYPALLQLRAGLVKAVPGESGNLAHLLTYTPGVTLPSLVIAHQLYGDVDIEQDVIDRNGIAHPGFVLGGRDLEVLSRG